jgi:hemerythrin
MSGFEWDDRLSVGVKSIDDQHKELVKMVNQLAEAMAAGKGQDAMGQVFNGLVKYTVSHFAHEEKLMSDHAYPQAVDHKKQHSDLKAQAIGLQNKAKEGGTVVTMETLHFLKDWLLHHIKGTDKAFGSFLNTKGVR